MRDPSPRAPFDQGLFLTHFNKGKALYDEKRFEEAERELEEAYLLRPRDQKVLNLLGLVYFKQDKYEKAEEVYRKLAAESPDAHTLFYNLGLIYFKLGRLEEAETAFLKALELNKDNPKINFYLGSIYERLHRFQDAIYQYRQAGRQPHGAPGRGQDRGRTAGGRPPSPPAAPATPSPSWPCGRQAQARRHRGVPGQGRGARPGGDGEHAPPEQDAAAGERHPALAETRRGATWTPTPRASACRPG